MSRDARYISLINTTRWRKVRGLILSAEPLCQRCRQRGKLTSAREVHHIVPLESISDPAEQERMAYAVSNLMSVCRDCHKAIHRELSKGTREERRRRREGEVKSFAEQWLSADPGGEFLNPGEVL